MPGFKYSPEYKPAPSTVAPEVTASQLQRAYTRRDDLTLTDGAYALSRKANRRNVNKPMPGSFVA